MNVATIVILLFIVALFGLALRHVLKHGSCSECGKNCAEGSAGSSCGSCSACQGCGGHLSDKE